MSNESLKVLPLLPLREIVVFPYTAVPLFIGRVKSILAIEKAYETDKLIFLSAQKDAKLDNPTENDIYKVGTVCKIIQLLKLPDGTLKILVEGLNRGRIVRFLSDSEYFLVEAELKTEIIEADVETIALIKLCKESLEEYSHYNKKLNPEIVNNLLNIDNPSEFSDRLAAILNLKLEQNRNYLKL